MKIDPATENSFQDLGDRVVIFDELAEDIIYDIADGEGVGFLDQFEILGRDFMGDPGERFYQGVTFVTVIRRKSDGSMFGYEFWRPVDKYAESILEPNGDEHGYDYDYPRDFDWDEDYRPLAYVFLPVKTFTITGYQVQS